MSAPAQMQNNALVHNTYPMPSWIVFFTQDALCNIVSIWNYRPVTLRVDSNSILTFNKKEPAIFMRYSVYVVYIEKWAHFKQSPLSMLETPFKEGSLWFSLHLVTLLQGFQQRQENITWVPVINRV